MGMGDTAVSSSITGDLRICVGICSGICVGSTAAPTVGMPSGERKTDFFGEDCVLCGDCALCGGGALPGVKCYKYVDVSKSESKF